VRILDRTRLYANKANLEVMTAIIIFRNFIRSPRGSRCRHRKCGTIEVRPTPSTK
jgi:hypothetical protein